MNKLLAAGAALAIVLPGVAHAADVSVQRQTFLDQGEAPQTLRKTVLGDVLASGTIGSYQCALAWEGTAPTAAELASPAPGEVVPDASVAGTTTDFTNLVGTLVLTYNGRINPQGMAVGNAYYEGMFSAVSGLNPALDCPSGGTVILGYVEPTPPETTLELDPVCQAERQAFVDAENAAIDIRNIGVAPQDRERHIGYAYGQYCDEIEVPVEGTGNPGDPGSPFSYSYAPSSTPTVTVTSATVTNVS